jgi:hypothetical protein
MNLREILFGQAMEDSHNNGEYGLVLKGRSYRRFFEGYSEYTVSRRYGPGTRIVRVYTGAYYQAELTEKDRLQRRLVYTVLLTAAAALYAAGILARVGSNMVWYVALSEVMASFFLGWSLVSLFHYATAGVKMTIREYREAVDHLKLAAQLSVFSLILPLLTKIFYLCLHSAAITAQECLNVVLFPIAGIFMTVAQLIIKHWDTIKVAIVKIVTAAVEKVKQVWGSIESFFHNLMANIRTIWQGVWNGILEFVGNLIEGIKADWQDFGFFLYGLWEGIKEGAAIIWEGIKGIFFGVIDGIKAAWQDFTGFFSGLWEAIRQGPAEAIEYIKNAFFGLFNSIQEKLFGFIGKIREGWETVKGFFGNIAGGVVNFFTGGDSGRGGSQMQPAYAGGTSQAAMAGAVGQTSNYAYTTMGGNSTVNAQTSINVNVPPGTSREQSEAIARQIDAQFDARLAGEINSSRSNIPSPEVRRH